MSDGKKTLEVLGYSTDTGVCCSTCGHYVHDYPDEAFGACKLAPDSHNGVERSGHCPSHEHTGKRQVRPPLVRPEVV